MNSLFKMLCMALASFHGISFSMIPHYKNKENKEIFEKSPRKYAISIAAQSGQKERERWATLSKEEQDFCKLEKLYRNQNNPKFVRNFLIKHSIPVLVINMGNAQTKMYGIVSPYEKSFYREPDKQIFDESICIACMRASQQKDAIQKGIGKYQGEFSHPLMSSVICGKDEDILKELQKLNECADKVKHSLVYQSIIGALNYYHRKKNNALELLLSHEQARTKKWANNTMRCIFASKLLCCTASDKELFGLISNKDPYNFNRELYAQSTSHQPTTLLDLMKEARDIFDQENIDIFMREGGGMTAEEVTDMEQVERILNKQITFEEEQQREFFEGHMDRVSNNKYLESLRIQGRLPEPLIIAQRRNVRLP